jgi:hypothetical protein
MVYKQLKEILPIACGINCNILNPKLRISKRGMGVNGGPRIGGV